MQAKVSQYQWLIIKGQPTVQSVASFGSHHRLIFCPGYVNERWCQVCSDTKITQAIGLELSVIFRCNHTPCTATPSPFTLSHLSPVKVRHLPNVRTLSLRKQQSGLFHSAGTNHSVTSDAYRLLGCLVTLRQKIYRRHFLCNLVSFVLWKVSFIYDFKFQFLVQTRIQHSIQEVSQVCYPGFIIETNDFSLTQLLKYIHLHNLLWNATYFLNEMIKVRWYSSGTHRNWHFCLFDKRLKINAENNFQMTD